MTDPALADIIHDLHWLINRSPDLWEARQWGTRPHWTQRALTTEQRQARDQQAREERAALDQNARLHMAGYTRAPLRVEVLDQWVDLLCRAHDLHETVAQTIGHPRLDPPGTAYADPNPYLAYAAELLPEAADTNPALLGAAAWVAWTRDQVRATLGEVEDGMTLHTVCPFCQGVTPTAPAGGAHTLTVRSIPRPTRADHEATEWMIVCEGGNCTPLDAECGTWLRGQPAWPWTDWEWLAARLVA